VVEYELSADAQVGVLVRTRIRQYEETHPKVSVHVADIQGVWDIRFTRGEGSNRSGTAYISIPEVVGRIARMRWPVDKKADISKIEYQNTAGWRDSFLLP
jgi:hypothetical protein